MERRTLVRIASGVGLGLVAGCLGAADDSSNGDGSTWENETTETADKSGTNTENKTDTDEYDVLEDDTELTFETLETDPFELIATTSLDESEDEKEDEESNDVASDIEEETIYHRLTVENESDQGRDLTIQIDRDGTTVLEGTNELPAETGLEIVIGEPGSYETTLETGGISNTSSISRSGPPCEESRTVVSFTDSGIETNTTTSC